MVLLYLFVTLALSTGANSNLSPDQTVAEFYSTNVALHGHGLPDSNALKSIAPFISSSFAKLLQQARAAEVACIKDTPAGLKPPIWATAIFSQTWGDATSVDRIVVKTKSSESASVVANLKYAPTEFHEVILELSNKGGIWAINDLKYPDGTSLNARLFHYAHFKCAFE